VDLLTRCAEPAPPVPRQRLSPSPINGQDANEGHTKVSKAGDVVYGCVYACAVLLLVLFGLFVLVILAIPAGGKTPTTPSSPARHAHVDLDDKQIRGGSNDRLSFRVN
jgi:hypothetical protein